MVRPFAKPFGFLRRHPRAVRRAGGLLLLAALAVWLAGPSVEVWYRLRAARNALARRDFDSAGHHLARCLEVSPDHAEAHFLAAQAARRTGALDRAEEHLQACERGHWSPETTALERALLRAQLGDPGPVAVRLLALEAEGHPDGVLILEALAFGFLKTYQLDQLRGCLERWLQRAPDDAQALLWQGELEERRNRPREAADAYRRALDAAPDWADPRLRLARVLARSGEHREAARHFEQLLVHAPFDSAVVVGLAGCRDALGAPREAARLLDDLLAVRPEEVEALTERGRLALAAREADRAETWLARAVRLAPFERAAVFQFCRCLEQRGRGDEAASWRRRLRQIEDDLDNLRATHQQILRSPRDPELRCQAGRILLRNRQDREGRRWLYSALQIAPDHRPTHKALAEHFRGRGDDRRADYHEQFAQGERPDGAAYLFDPEPDLP